MVGFALGSDSKYLNSRWHLVREKARRETFSLEEWGDIDIEDYDLDEGFKGLPGDYPDRMFRVGPTPIESEGSPSESFDLRDLPTHD